MCESKGDWEQLLRAWQQQGKGQDWLSELYELMEVTDGCRLAIVRNDDAQIWSNALEQSIQMLYM